MTTVTIVTDDAERLVREGGVVNRASLTKEDIPSPLPYRVEVYKPCDCLGTAHFIGRHEESRNPWGTVVVVGVHYADDCYRPNYSEDGMLLSYEACHPDAEPGMWHWTVQP